MFDIDAYNLRYSYMMQCASTYNFWSQISVSVNNEKSKSIEIFARNNLDILVYDLVSIDDLSFNSTGLKNFGHIRKILASIDMGYISSIGYIERYNRKLTKKLKPSIYFPVVQTTNYGMYIRFIYVSKRYEFSSDAASYVHRVLENPKFDRLDLSHYYLS